MGKTDHYNSRFGWHHLEMDVSTDDNPLKIEVESDLTLTGPFLGFAIDF